MVARLLCSTLVTVVVGVATPALAGKLSTPFVLVNGGQFVICVATNTGTTPAAVTMDARAENGSNLGFSFSNCSDTLAAGASCYSALPDNQDAACGFTVLGRVKASIQVYEGSPAKVVMGFPAAK